MTLRIGIDPGLSGAIAILDQAGEFVSVTDLPIVRDLSLAWVDGGEFQSLILTALEGRRAADRREQSRCRESTEGRVDRPERTHEQIGPRTESADLCQAALVIGRPSLEMRELGDYDARTIDDSRDPIGRPKREDRAGVRENRGCCDRRERGERIFGHYVFPECR